VRLGWRRSQETKFRISVLRFWRRLIRDCARFVKKSEGLLTTWNGRLLTSLRRKFDQLLGNRLIGQIQPPSLFRQSGVSTRMHSFHDKTEPVHQRNGDFPLRSDLVPRDALLSNPSLKYVTDGCSTVDLWKHPRRNRAELHDGFPAILDLQPSAGGIVRKASNERIPRREPMRNTERRHEVNTIDDPVPTTGAPVRRPLFGGLQRSDYRP